MCSADDRVVASIQTTGQCSEFWRLSASNIWNFSTSQIHLHVSSDFLRAFMYEICLMNIRTSTCYGFWLFGDPFLSCSAPSLYLNKIFVPHSIEGSRSWWSCGRRSGSAATSLLGLWVRILQGTWMSVSCECRVLSSRGPCDRLITRPEQSYRTLCVVVCDTETSWMRRPWLALGRSARRKNYEGEASFIA
jgi:hypothetical protein